MKKFTKTIALILCFALTAGFSACGDKKTEDEITDNKNIIDAEFDLSKNGEYTADNETYIIGATAPLTGDNANYGISVKNGAEIAIEEINAAGGLNGVEFKVEFVDDKATATDASNGYDILFEKGMQVGLGGITSGSCESFASRADEDGLFFMTPSASAQSIIDVSDYAFRVCFGDPDQGILAARTITENYENIGAIYDSSDTYSTGVYAAFKDEMAKLGREYNEQSFDADNKRDFSTQLEALKDCDVIFLPIYFTEAGLIAKACAAKGCDAVLFGCDGFDGIRNQIDDTVTNDIKYITPFDAESEDEDVKNFVAEYKEKYNVTPDQFAADGYDAVHVLFDAMKAAGVDNVHVDPAELGKALIKAVTDKSFSHNGLTGDMTWDVSGACNKVPVIVEFDR